MTNLEANKNSAIAPYLVNNKNGDYYYPFTLVSRIGQVYDFKNEYRHRKEFLVDTKIGDFVMPKNSNKSIFDLARIYGFYESSNGINVKGKEFTIKNINYGNANSFMIEEPVLVGDILIFKEERRVMIDTVNIYNGNISFPWKVTYQYVLENDFNYPLAKPKDETEQPQYYKALYDTKNIIKAEVLDIVNTLANNLGNCANGGGPIVPSTIFTANMKAAKEKFEANINTALENEKNASY